MSGFQLGTFKDLENIMKSIKEREGSGQDDLDESETDEVKDWTKAISPPYNSFLFLVMISSFK